MTSIPNALSLLPLHSISSQDRIRVAKAWSGTNLRVLLFDSCRFGRGRRRSGWVFWVRASGGSFDAGGGQRAGDGGRIELGRNGLGPNRRIVTLQGMIDALPPAVLVVKRNVGSKFAIGLFIAFAFLVVVVRQVIVKKQSSNQRGSVADLVKRGQLRSDRRGISKPLKYEDPFNNPLVKVGKSSSTIEMFGKVYRLAPVTLTEDQQSIHQKRRSRAYQWKRPTIFLKEGDSIPPDVDPDTVRWIPANHPFATTVSDIDEDLAHNNVFQKDGVPFRVKAEHEQLQKKLEALQSEHKLNKVAINPKNIRDLERSVKSAFEPHEQIESSPPGTQHSGHTTSNPDQEVASRVIDELN